MHLVCESGWTEKFDKMEAHLACETGERWMS